MSSRRLSLMVGTLVAWILAGAIGVAGAEEVQAEGTPALETLEASYMGLSSGPLADAIIGDLEDGVVLQSDDLKVTRRQIDSFITERATSARSKAAFEAEALFIAEQLLVEPLLTREAKQWAKEQGLDVGGAALDAHLQAIADAVVVSDEEVQAFYDANKDMMEGAALGQVEGQIRSTLLRDKQNDAVMEHVDGLSSRMEIIVDAEFLAEVAPKALDNAVDRARRSGKPTFVDFGSEGCGPCDMMAPIIEELRAELADRVNVVLIQVPAEQHLSARYGIRAIPVQFIYDAEGREVFDHTGFLSKQAILRELAKLGVE